MRAIGVAPTQTKPDESGLKAILHSLIPRKENFKQLDIHCVWAAWDRLHLITPDIQQVIYAPIIAEAKKLGCKVINVGGIEDRIHL